MKRSKSTMKPETLAIHAGMPANEHGGVSVPIYQSATFSFSEADQGAARFAGTESGYIYTRLGNPTVNALEDAVCALEEGHAALGTSAGMAAISTVLLTILRSGDHVVATDAVYGATRVLLERQLTKFGIETPIIAKPIAPTSHGPPRRVAATRPSGSAIVSANSADTSASCAVAGIRSARISLTARFECSEVPRSSLARPPR